MESVRYRTIHALAERLGGIKVLLVVGQTCVFVHISAGLALNDRCLSHAPYMQSTLCSGVVFPHHLETSFIGYRYLQIKRIYNCRGSYKGRRSNCKVLPTQHGGSTRRGVPGIAAILH